MFIPGELVVYGHTKVFRGANLFQHMAMEVVVMLKGLPFPGDL